MILKKKKRKKKNPPRLAWYIKWTRQCWLGIWIVKSSSGQSKAFDCPKKWTTIIDSTLKFFVTKFILRLSSRDYWTQKGVCYYIMMVMMIGSNWILLPFDVLWDLEALHVILKAIDLYYYGKAKIPFFNFGGSWRSKPLKKVKFYPPKK